MKVKKEKTERKKEKRESLSGRDLVENQGATEREERASRKGRERREVKKKEKKIKEKRGFTHNTHLEVLTH